MTMGFSKVISKDGATSRYAAPAVPGTAFVMRRIKSEPIKLRLKLATKPGVGDVIPSVDTLPSWTG